MSTSFVKDPDAILDYHVNWANWLSFGDAIASSEWFITSVDLDTPIASSALTIEKHTFTNTVATVWLSGGDNMHYLVNRVTTTQGKRDDRHIKIRIQHK